MIECLYYNRKSEQREQFMLSEVSTLEVTTLLDSSMRLQTVQVLSYAGDKYLGEGTLSKFDTIEVFNRFFINNPQFYIHDCMLQLENGLIISSHDDGEVHIEQPINFEGRKLIKSVFIIKGLSEELISEAMNHPDCYFSLDQDGKVVAIHKTFDDYLNRSG